jgi:hypothetical protein
MLSVLNIIKNYQEMMHDKRIVVFYINGHGTPGLLNQMDGKV